MSPLCEPTPMPIEIAFRELTKHGLEAGDLLLRPRAAADQARRDFATLVAEAGPDALVSGGGPVRRIVVPASPTLDDLLAAAFAERLLKGRPLPDGARAFARYAALQREGLQPGEVPLVESLEGVFLALRNAGGENLTDPAVGGAFARSWRRMAEVILAAAEAGRDPFRTPLFGGEAFARERAFLSQDREVYRQDVLRGERWRVRVPGGPAQASGLLLREPKALLAKQWARRDEAAPVGHAYLFLAVRWGPGSWVFSTDPVQRLSLKPLADALEAAEARQRPAEPVSDPWFDGQPFAHTLVASPRSGTRLPEAEVLRVVRAFARASRAPSPGRRRLGLVLAGLGGVALSAAALLLLRRPDAPAGPTVDFTYRGLALAREAKAALKPPRGFALLVGVGKRQSRLLDPLPGAAPDVAQVYALLRDRFGYAPDDMLVLCDEPERVRTPDGAVVATRKDRPDRPGIERAIEDVAYRVKVAVEQGDAAQFVFYYAGHGTPSLVSDRLGYLVLAGYLDERESAQDSRGYDMAHLGPDLRTRINARHQLLLIDCCFSGFTARTRGDPLDAPSEVFELWSQEAQAVITAGRRDQKVHEPSIFHRVLLEGLGGGEPPGRMLADGYVKGGVGGSPDLPDGIVTDAELGLYLTETVPSRCRLAHKDEHTPLYVRGLEGDGVGQFLLIPRAR